MSFLQRLGYLTAATTVSGFGYYAYWRQSERRHEFNAFSTGDHAINGKNLSGKTAIVTGCNAGIGKETARVLTKQGCNVIMACRSKNRANAARNDILNTLGLSQDYDKLSVMELDLASLESVKSFATEYNSKGVKLDYLINNAGVAQLTKYTRTRDGIEMQFGVNHIGHFYLTNLLVPSLIMKNEQGGEKSVSRVINVASGAEGMLEESYASMLEMFDKSIEEKQYYPSTYVDKYRSDTSYCISKMSNILFTRKLAKKYDNQLISVSLQPGFVADTELGRHMKPSLETLKTMYRMFKNGGLLAPHKFLTFLWEEFKDSKQGCATTLRCVSLSDDQIKNGSYYYNCRDRDDKLIGPASKDINGELSSKLWQLSEILLQSKGYSIE